MTHSHAVAWIDHGEAHIIHFNADESEQLTVHSKHRNSHLHHKNGQIGDGRAPEDQQFYHEVANALQGAEKILIVGPANAKSELEKHMKHHDKDLAAGIVGVETVDHPTDGQVLQLARKHFTAADRTLP
ncbi:MAG TPA: translational machinery protein [Usitatibacteraceae bacterium]